MSQRSHRKRKDDTWTKEELSSALHSKEEKSHQRVKHNSTAEKDQRSRSEKPRERKSKYQDLEKLLNEHEESQHRKSSHEQSSEREEKRQKSKKEYTREEEKRKLRRKTEKERETSNEFSNVATRDSQEKGKERETRHKNRERDIKTTGDYQRERRHKNNEEIEQKMLHEDENNDRGLKERKHREKSEKKLRHGETERKSRHHDKSGRKQRPEDYETEKEKRRKQKEEKQRLEVHENRNLKHKRSTHTDKADYTEREANGKTHRGRTTTSTESSESSKVLEDEEKEMYNYDDEEFENYEDDFEDEDDEDVDSHQKNPMDDNNSEMSEIIRAINEENERIASARTSSARSLLKQSTPSEDLDSGQSSVSNLFTTNINFSSKGNKQNSRILKKMLKRHKDLSSLIQLDFVSLDFFELTPVTEYNFYIKSFGTQNSRQVSSQCNDDALHVEVQTDVPEIAEKWSQQPQDGSLSSGGTHLSNAPNTATGLSVSMNQDVQSLAIFMEYAQNLMDASFLEASLWSGSQQGRQSSLSFCDSCSKLNTNISYLQGREILTCSFGVDMLAVAFSAAKQQFSARIDRKYLIAIWKITDTENPYRVLVCDSTPTSCCFAVVSKNVFFAATEDGCILAYDLKEPGTMHQRVQLERQQLNVLRSPTYTTGCRGDAHSSPVLTLSPLSQDASTDQIFSLEENSRLCIWLVVDVISDADDDLGLVPQGQVKLVKSMTLDVPGTNRTTCACCPDAKTFYVGNDSGDIVSLTREKKQNIYSSNCPGDVTCVAFSRICGGFFLTSHQGGSVCLFMTKQDCPLMSWSLECDRVLSCDWSNRRSSVFFALDSSNQMHVWDLMAIDSAPVATSSLSKRCVGFCADQRSSGSSHLLIVYESNEVELHQISTHFTDSVTPDEVDNMTSSILFFV